MSKTSDQKRKASLRSFFSDFPILLSIHLKILNGTFSLDIQVTLVMNSNLVKTSIFFCNEVFLNKMYVTKNHEIEPW